MKQKAKPTVFITRRQLLCLCLLLAFLALPACAAESAPAEAASAAAVSAPLRAIRSEALRADALLQRYAESAGISYGEALACFPEKVKAARSGAEAAYCVVSVSLTEEADAPELEVYCEISGAQEAPEITGICSVQMRRSACGEDAAGGKIFAGDVQVWLREEGQIEYAVNGDFYESGSVAISGSAEDDGASACFHFTLPDSFDGAHEQYFYDHQTIALS